MIPELSSVNDPDIQVSILKLFAHCWFYWRITDFLQAEIRRLLSELDQLKDKTVRGGHTQFAARLAAMSQAARQGNVAISPVATTEVLDSNTIVATADTVAGNRLENGPANDHRIQESEVDLRQRKSSHSVKEKAKSTKNSPDSGMSTFDFNKTKTFLSMNIWLFFKVGLGGLMFNSGPVVNNVLACMTDKIVCATFSADPSAVVEEDEEGKDAVSSTTVAVVQDLPPSQPASGIAPVSSLALAAAPLLTSNFAFDTRGVTVLRNYSAPNSRRSSDQQDSTASESAQLSLVGDHTNSGALLFHADPSSRGSSISVQSLCQLPAEQISCSTPANHSQKRRQSEASASPKSGQNQANRRYPLSPKVKHKLTTAMSSPACIEDKEETEMSIVSPQVDSSVKSAQITPDSTPGRSLSSSRSRINTDDRERFTEEVTV